MKIIPTLAGVLGLAALLSGACTAATVPGAFTATYQVSRNGQPLGTATVTLRPAGDGAWTYRKDVSGTGGLAALLNASVHESSELRWRGDVPEALSYDYELQSAIKSKQRHLQVNWTTGQVTVDEGKRSASYAAQPGMVERNTLPLALGLALQDGQQTVALPVAVRQTVEKQQFKVVGTEAVTVPAGSFQALHVERTDADRGFSAWYVPKRFPLPVKLSQHDDDAMEMVLVSFKQS